MYIYKCIIDVEFPNGVVSQLRYNIEEAAARQRVFYYQVQYSTVQYSTVQYSTVQYSIYSIYIGVSAPLHGP